jgi:hypothetical protein
MIYIAISENIHGLNALFLCLSFWTQINFDEEDQVFGVLSVMHSTKKDYVIVSRSVHNLCYLKLFYFLWFMGVAGTMKMTFEALNVKIIFH